MRKYLFRVFGYAILSVVIAGMGTVIGIQHKRIKEHKEANKYLMNENDELRKLKTYSYNFAVNMHVRDQSKITLYGRNNKGTQTVPSDRNWNIKIDSSSFIQLIDKSKIE